ncbi:glycosyltransferase family 39 protein [Candidatus Woesebacteria bacterium]|nr:glycosyltransferase family 39 protein [Candidatus Woesebacteria bacterium]
MKKVDYLIITCVLLIGLCLRLYKIDTPLADLHSFRQADTAAVARNYSRDGINLLRPVYDDLSNIQTGYENTNGLRMVEFPVYNAIVALFYRYLPITSLEIYGRLTSAFFSLISIAIVYYFALKEKNRLAAIASSSIFAIFPFFVFFSRVVLPESTAVASMMLALLFLYKSTNEKKHTIVKLILGSVFFALAILIKPTTVFYGFTAVYLFISRYKFEVFKSWRPYIYFTIALIPFVLWRIYILQFPEGIPVSGWLFTTVNTSEGAKDIFFRPAFFRWIFMERIGTAMLGIYGVVFLIIGALGKYKTYFVHSMLFSGIAYIFTFQGGNVQHEYYQTILFPMISLLSGVGIAHMFEFTKKQLHHALLYPTVVLLVVLAWLFSYYKVQDYYYYPQDLPRIAELIKIFTSPEDHIVTDRSGDTTLLYLADRKGAPAIYKDLSELKALGYKYVVTANKELSDKYKEQGFAVVVENELFTMISL